MKLHKKILSLILSVSTLFCCFSNLFVKAADIDVSNYTYLVDNMTFYKGDEQINSCSGATEVAVDVTERIPTEENNTVIISAYASDGTYLGMNHTSQNFAFAKTQNIKLPLDIPAGKTVSEVRAFVWNSFNGMMPLSNALSSNSNTVIDSKIVYATGVFGAVNSQNKVTFVNSDIGASGFTLDPNDTSLKYHIYLNGKEITTDDLIAGDILSVAYDISADLTPKLAFAYSKYYEVYVSRHIVSGAVEEIDDENCKIKIDGTYYDFLNTTKYNSFSSSFNVIGDSYHFTLDAFGRIYSWELYYSAVNWAIAEKFTILSSDDDYKLTVFTGDGLKKAYYFDADNASVTKADGTVIDRYTEGSANALNAAVRALVYTSGTTKTAIEDRVIQYKVSSSSGKITDLKFIGISTSTIDEYAGTTMEAYSARRNTIGTVRLGEITKVVDATKYADKELSAVTYAGFTDGVEYKAYAYGTRINNVHPFVLVTEGEAAYTAATRFAVITEDGYNQEIDEETGDIVYTISALYGDAEKLVVSDDVATATLNGLKKGEVIFFKTNAAGQVTAIDKLFAWTNGAVPTQANLAAWSLVNDNTDYANLAANITIPTTFAGNFSADFTTDWDSTSRDAIKLVYGPVIEVGDKEISFGKVDASGKTNIETGVSIYNYSDDIRVYTYDYSQGADDRFDYQAYDIGSIPPTMLFEAYMDDGETVDWDKIEYGEYVNRSDVTFAFAIVVDDEIVDILAFFRD